MKVKPVMICDRKWLCDFAFISDITKNLSEPNIKLQGPTQFSNVKSFEENLKLWQVQLQRCNNVPAMKSECAGECVELPQDFGEMFQDKKSKQKNLTYLLYFIMWKQLMFQTTEAAHEVANGKQAGSRIIITTV